MEENYRPQEIEAKWQARWQADQLHRTRQAPDRPKFYCLDMYPFPSGGLHMGHMRNYIIGDVVARYHRMRGENVLHPMGFDAFGQPAEEAAIKRGSHPAPWTYTCNETMRRQFRLLGISYDWEREVVTCDPEYYRWDQWFFLQMLTRGLAYKKEAPVNWCPRCEIVLANEEVVGGACWRRSTRWWTSWPAPTAPRRSASSGSAPVPAASWSASPKPTAKEFSSAPTR